MVTWLTGVPANVAYGLLTALVIAGGRAAQVLWRRRRGSKSASSSSPSDVRWSTQMMRELAALPTADAPHYPGQYMTWTAPSTLKLPPL